MRGGGRVVFIVQKGECRAIKFKLWFKMNRDYRVVPDENRDSAPGSSPGEEKQALLRFFSLSLPR